MLDVAPQQTAGGQWFEGYAYRDSSLSFNRQFSYDGTLMCEYTPPTTRFMYRV